MTHATSTKEDYIKYFRPRRAKRATAPTTGRSDPDGRRSARCRSLNLNTATCAGRRVHSVFSAADAGRVESLLRDASTTTGHARDSPNDGPLGPGRPARGNRTSCQPNVALLHYKDALSLLWIRR